MAHDIVSQFYASLTLPLHERLIELTRIIDTSSPSKDLQTIFPQLICNIFSTSFATGWGLQTITYDVNRLDYEILVSFFEPQGPMFRLCYKLLSDPQLKYNLPLNALPMELQMSLERGRCPQFYADMLVINPQTMNVAALALNPFDYFVFNFALHLVNSTQNKTSWEHWNSVYFALACDYLTHFLPSDPNVPVLPHIPNYTGKVPMVAPLQTANRPTSPSLLLRSDVSMSSQHTPSQTQSRNEVWRSETVLQVFVDIWMSVDAFDTRTDLFQRNYPIMVSSPERVRTVRVLVKHIHSFSAKHLSDPAIRSSSLRKYARQIMCARAYQYVKYLVTTWPLDASFRLVMELWLSLIQPWRYANNNINRDRVPNSQRNQEEANVGSLDPSYIQFIAENYPSYTCILQLVLPRFMRLDLTAYKNAVMLFRLGKVFSQPHLVTILRDLEQAITESSSGYSSPETSFNNNSGFDFSYYSGSGLPLKKWAAIAKQAISEMNMSNSFDYEPLWSENKKQFGIEFVRKILAAKYIAENNAQESAAPAQQNQGLWASIANWLMITDTETDHALEELKKVPNYLNNCSHYFATIFGINEESLPPATSILEDNSAEHSSFSNVTNFPLTITNKLRNRTTDVHYMGDPDLAPITSYESTILVRMLYQISTRINEMYQDQFTNLWNRTDFWGYMAREVLQKPCTIHTYVKDCTSHQTMVRKELPPRLSLRRLGSHAFVTWISIGYILFRMFSYTGMTYLFFLIVLWTSYVVIKASMQFLNIVRV